MLLKFGDEFLEVELEGCEWIGIIKDCVVCWKEVGLLVELSKDSVLW